MLIYEHPFHFFFFECLLSSQQNNYHIKAVICPLMHFSNGFLAVVADLATCFFFFFQTMNKLSGRCHSIMAPGNFIFHVWGRFSPRVVFFLFFFAFSFIPF